MKILNHLTQIITIKMGIDFGGRYRFVSQHFLNSTKIGPSFDQVRSK
jgi:hypothetical protein